MAACWVVLPQDVHGSLLGCTTLGCTWQLVGLYYLRMYMAAAICNSLSMFINILEFLFKNLVFAKLSSDTLHQRHKQDLKNNL